HAGEVTASGKGVPVTNLTAEDSIRGLAPPSYDPRSFSAIVPKDPAACAMPPASAAAEVILLGAYEPEAISTTTIGSQDVTVRTAAITIEPGREPLYLVVSVFNPTIWRVSGAVERIERLVLTSNVVGPGLAGAGRPLVGATGVAAEKITFLQRGECI